jgi:hypothetical protein
MATKSKKASTAKASASLPKRLAPSQVSQSVQRINFRSAKVVPGIVSGTYILIVSGTKPYLNMEVHLSPLIYIMKPEYWGIEVIGTLPGIGLPALAPYQVHIQLDGITGTKGVEVLGKSTSKKLPVPPKSAARKKK